MTQPRTGLPVRLGRALEWALAGLGAGNAVIVSVTFGLAQLSTPPSLRNLWPLPGLYLLEIAVLGLGAFAAVAQDGRPGARVPPRVAWIAGGVLLTFVILGGFTIGLFLIPATLTFQIAALLADLRAKRNPLSGAAYGYLAALGQAALMLVLAV